MVQTLLTVAVRGCPFQGERRAPPCTLNCGRSRRLNTGTIIRSLQIASTALDHHERR